MDRVSQESSRVEHFLQDVYPFVVCCKGRFPDCSKYYEDRPSDDGSNFVPPTPPGIYLIQKKLTFLNLQDSWYFRGVVTTAHGMSLGLTLG